MSDEPRRARRFDPRVDDDAPVDAPVTPPPRVPVTETRARPPAIDARPPAVPVKAPPEVQSTALAEIATLQRQAREAEARATAAETKVSDLTAAHAIARKLQDDLKETLDAERKTHERTLAELEEKHAAALEKSAADQTRAIDELKKDFDDAKAQLATPAAAAREAGSQVSAEGAPRAPKYYGAPTIPIVTAPQESTGPSKRGLRILAQVVVVLLIAGGIYQNRTAMRRAISPIVDMPKITGTREEVGRIVDSLSKEETLHGLPAPDDLGAYLRENTQSKTGDASKDLWETPFRLEVTATSFAVRSAGPDREYETDDDVLMEHSRAPK